MITTKHRTVPNIPGITNLPGVTRWDECGRGWAGWVRTLWAAKRLKLALLAAGYTYQGFEVRGHGDSKYWQECFWGTGGEFYIRYHPEGGQRKPECQPGARPEYLHLPLNLAAFAAAFQAQWSPADNILRIEGDACADELFATLAAIGFENRGSGLFRDANSGQGVLVIRVFDTGADGAKLDSG